MSDLGGLSVGLSGLEASRQALDLIGQDVANANTPGYVAERLQLSAAGGALHPGFNDPVHRALVSGVAIDGVTRMANSFLQAQSVAAHSSNGSIGAQQSALAQIQEAFPEPGENGLSAQFGTFFKSWDDLAQNPGDGAVRASVLTAGATLAAGLNAASQAIASTVASSSSRLTQTVGTVNTLAGQIAQLNGSIRTATNAGRDAGSLEDQRDALVSSLSDHVGVRLAPQADGTVSLYVGTEALVTGDTSQQLSVQGAGSTTSLRWSADGSTLQDAGGEVGGLMTVMTSTAPAITASLDTVAATLAGALNHAQAAGVTTSGAAGAPFFSGTTAGTIAVALTDPSQLAAASAGSPTPRTGANLDGSNAAAIAEMATAQTVTTAAGPTTGPVAAYHEMITTLGGTVASVNIRATTQAAAVSSADSAYSNATGVNTDEEMARMVQFQNAYSASAKYISTIKGTIDSLLSMVQ